MKQKPQWVLQREQLNNTQLEQVSFVGELGVAGVIDGKLPNGEPYTWYKRKNIKTTKYKGRRK